MYKEPYDNLTNLFESPCNLQPQTQYKQEIELHLKELIQCSGCILLSIPNPLTQEKKIEIKHAFGLYLIDQVCFFFFFMLIISLIERVVGSL